MEEDSGVPVPSGSGWVTLAASWFPLLLQQSWAQVSFHCPGNTHPKPSIGLSPQCSEGTLDAVPVVCHVFTVTPLSHFSLTGFKCMWEEVLVCALRINGLE